MEDERQNDEELSRRVQTGDEVAFAELYGRYVGRIYDFALRLAQDRDTAALVVQSTFLRTYRVLREGQEGAVHLQIYAGAHHDTAERLRRRRGLDQKIDEPYAAIDPSRLPGPPDDLAELGRIAWAAAVELKVNDYELLDLSVRQQLSAREIATVLRARPETIDHRLHSASEALEQAFSARVLFSAGRRECLDLDFEIGDAAWSASLARRILRHADTCQVCLAVRAHYPGAGAALAALMAVPAPAGWEETILDRLQVAVKREPASGVSTTAPVEEPVTPLAPKQSALPESGGGGESVADWLESVFGGGGPRGPLLAALFGGLLAAVIVIASLCAGGVFDGGGDDEPAPTGTITATATPSASATPTGTATPTRTATFAPQPQPTQPPADTDTPEPSDTPPAPTSAPPPTEKAPVPSATQPPVATSTP